MTTLDLCPDCDGSGEDPGRQWHCRTCFGSGFVVNEWRDCGTCEGEGCEMPDSRYTETQDLGDENCCPFFISRTGPALEEFGA